MQLLCLRHTVFSIMLLVWGTLAEMKEDDTDKIKTTLEQEKEIMTLPQNEAKLWRWLADLERRVGNQCDKQTINSIVGFTAELTTSQNYPRLKTIVFDKVLENQGGGYNSHTGVFRAPYRGMYLFSVTIHSIVREQLLLELMKNQSYIGRVVAGDSKSDWGDSGSVSVITTMDKGDEVYARSMYNANIYGNQWSSFMGVLISRF
ncbi:hypothetical protein CHS0354_043176 [Potamilus streckersoni]|uniref:C1q domain-containing protein n=1 Tax=Potamilus streckersoni TaxID=2493646 RepID=A0AAE0VY89_9BIVA|nr:hypothetical protein CHS0354_043176 [Potamilus streckersoni]